MTYIPPNAAAAANYKSRALKKQRAGLPLSNDQIEFLAKHQPHARHVAPPIVERAPARAPAPVHHGVEPEVSPSVSPGVPPSPRASLPDMTVIDFGQPQSPLGAPAKGCPPNCQHLSHAHAAVQRCAINGEKQYPPMKPNASKGIARGAFFVTGFLIAIFKGFDEVPDPTPVEIEDGADAVTDIVATRYPQLGIYSDLLAGGYALSAYSIRTMNLPREKKAP